MTTRTTQPTIVLIPGLWETALAWEHWVDATARKVSM
jgi:hypothetical protein